MMDGIVQFPEICFARRGASRQMHPNHQPLQVLKRRAAKNKTIQWMGLLI
jgi:hypothetical protein